jgi:hypothetical protein
MVFQLDIVSDNWQFNHSGKQKSILCYGIYRDFLVQSFGFLLNKRHARIARNYKLKTSPSNTYNFLFFGGFYLFSTPYLCTI